jgi:hypothetical protein
LRRLAAIFSGLRGLAERNKTPCASHSTAKPTPST